MSWLRELKLGDLPADETLEIVCRKCGSARYETAAALSARTLPGACEGERISLATAYLDQVEARLRCRRCGGPGRLSRVARQDRGVCRWAAMTIRLVDLAVQRAVAADDDRQALSMHVGRLISDAEALGDDILTADKKRV